MVNRADRSSIEREPEGGRELHLAVS